MAEKKEEKKEKKKKDKKGKEEKEEEDILTNAGSPRPLSNEKIDEFALSWINIRGVPRDCTQREPYILFSGCKGFKVAKVFLVASPGLGGESRVAAQAMVGFDTPENLKLALKARQGTAWSDRSYPIAYEVMPEGKATDALYMQLKQKEAHQKSIDRASASPGASQSPGSGQVGPTSLQRRQKAQLMLESAIASHKSRELERALATAREAGLTEDELAEAEETLAAMEWRITARKVAADRDRKSMAIVRIAEAVHRWDVVSIPISKRIGMLKEAVKCAKAAGIDETDYADAIALIETQDAKMKAELALERMLTDLQPEMGGMATARDRIPADELRTAVQNAAASGVGEIVLKRAAFALAMLERKTNARARLLQAASGTGVRRGAIFVNKDLQNDLIEAFDEAKKAGVDEHDVTWAKTTVAGERKAFAEKNLEEAMKTKNIATLEASIKEGKLSGADPGVIERAQKLLEEQQKKVLGKKKEKSDDKKGDKGMKKD